MNPLELASVEPRAPRGASDPSRPAGRAGRPLWRSLWSAGLWLLVAAALVQLAYLVAAYVLRHG